MKIWNLNIIYNTMAKRLSREEKREKALIDIINQMFVIAGHDVTFDDIKDRKDDWFTDWTMTTAQAEEWKKWGVDYLRKELKMNKGLAEREMMWVNVQWGLKYSDFNV
jgi:hypothetical protein